MTPNIPTHTHNNHLYETACFSFPIIIITRVVGGLDVLTEMERIPTDSNDGPTVCLKLCSICVPYFIYSLF